MNPNRGSSLDYYLGNLSSANSSLLTGSQRDLDDTSKLFGSNDFNTTSIQRIVNLKTSNGNRKKTTTMSTDSMDGLQPRYFETSRMNKDNI